ncbi:DNA repair protein RadA [Candidatus Nanosyncoccus alces]|uniref:DNA repair protein RadA n=1 Tax=Candidatus Nanosyncoccus alces TaxID=2171997 RepID=A0ABY0FNS5_9BACT|nr:DNA repair protein RadA [Candidatus Nanosyncoccus alces]RYC74863.1 DNA repair protein RadA [Candidatus Nanosyncoccus alces]
MKSKSQFVCQQCGASYAKWVGQCTNCNGWNSLVEQVVEVELGKKSAIEKGRVSGKKLDFVKLNTVTPSDAKARLLTEFDDLNAVLGGGILMGSVSLLAGQPGIGKSTILMQICAEVAKKHSVLYISGEESAGQVKLRAERLGAKSDKLNFAASTSGNDIAKTIETGEFDLVIVDSIQTLAMDEISSAPGTVSQVTNCGNLIIRAAKATDTAVIIVGHVTKEGTLAGPKVLEHLVDVVLNFEGDRYGGFKTVRAVKNRFGSTNEVAIFEMVESGLKEVQNPSAALLAERTNTDGSIILATMEGNRPILVEIQALATQSNYGYPKRTASGFDINRLNLLIAVMERRTKLRLSDKDIFINVVGGMKLQDSAADLAVCMAIASAVAGRKLSEEYVVFGEVGLGGEVRSAFRASQRIAEAKKLGFKHAIAPRAIKDPFVIPAKDLRETLIKYVK